MHASLLSYENGISSFRLSSQLASQRSGTLVTAIPLEQLEENSPNLSRLRLKFVAARGPNAVALTPYVLLERLKAQAARRPQK